MWTRSLAQVIDTFQYLVDESASLEAYQVKNLDFMNHLSRNCVADDGEINVAKLIGLLFEICDDDKDTWVRADWQRIAEEYSISLSEMLPIQVSLDHVDWENHRIVLQLFDGESVVVPLIVGQVSTGEGAPCLVYRSRNIREPDGFYSWMDVLFVEETRNRFLAYVRDELVNQMKDDYIEIFNGASLSNVELTKIDNSIRKYLSGVGYTLSTDRQQMRKLIPLYELPETSRLYWNDEFSIAVFNNASSVRALLFDNSGRMTRTESIVEHISNIQSGLEGKLNKFLKIKGLVEANLVGKEKLTVWIPAVIVVIISVIDFMAKLLHWGNASLSDVTTLIFVVFNLITLCTIFLFGIVPSLRAAWFSWDIRS